MRRFSGVSRIENKIQKKEFLLTWIFSNSANLFFKSSRFSCKKSKQRITENRIWRKRKFIPKGFNFFTRKWNEFCIKWFFRVSACHIFVCCCKSGFLYVTLVCGSYWCAVSVMTLCQWRLLGSLIITSSRVNTLNQREVQLDLFFSVYPTQG